MTVFTTVSRPISRPLLRPFYDGQRLAKIGRMVFASKLGAVAPQTPRPAGLAKDTVWSICGIRQPEFVRTKRLRVFPAKHRAPEGARGVGSPAASLSPHVVGSVFVTRLRSFAFATKSGIGYPVENGFVCRGNLEGG